MEVNFSSKWYDALKWVALILLPAMAMLYSGLAPLWGFPFVNEVVGTISAVDLFLGALLGVAVMNYRRQASAYKLVIPEGKLRNTVNWILPNTAYEWLTWVAQIVLPAVATLYFSIAMIWGLPYAEQVVSSIMAIDVFLGMLLGFSASQFNKAASFKRVINI